MSKEVYRRLSKAERKLENTNRLRTNNTTLRIKYEGIKKLLEKKDKEIERLNKELEVAKNNEETYRLEMLDITKRLGLDEETLFDDVKDKAERLNSVIEWQQNKIAKLNSENVCLKAEIELHKDGYKLVEENRE